MNKRLLRAALAMGAFFAGSQASQPTATSQYSDMQQARDLAKQSWPLNLREQKPAKPESQPAAQRKVVAQAPPMVTPGFTRFIEKPHLRKVKYGKRRWVMV